ncbi:MAG: hypothetical protein LBP36_02325 [Oscillospiraceae bacterium]|jgi:hypothetical protein|nr:hypothetical protein [Oscillospiraceae bacterium]
MKFKFRNITFAALAFVFMASAVPSKASHTNQGDRAILGDKDDRVKVGFFSFDPRDSISKKYILENFYGNMCREDRRNEVTLHPLSYDPSLGYNFGSVHILVMTVNVTDPDWHKKIDDFCGYISDLSQLINGGFVKLVIVPFRVGNGTVPSYDKFEALGSRLGAIVVSDCVTFSNSRRGLRNLCRVVCEITRDVEQVLRTSERTDHAERAPLSLDIAPAVNENPSNTVAIESSSGNASFWSLIVKFFRRLKLFH